MLTAIAALPILLSLAFLVLLRWPAIRTMPICAAVTAACAYQLWGVTLPRISAAIVEAAWLTVSILLIVFGAMFFLSLLRDRGAIAVLQQSVGKLSPDARIQAVLIGWTLGSFLEGAAGFGTPAAMTAPLLIGLGFPPLHAVVVALVGDSTAVSFGAVGTPILIGMGQGLAGTDADPAILLGAIAQRIVTLDLVLGTLMPVIVVYSLVLSQRQPTPWTASLKATPFALCVGFAQAATSWIVVAALGPEFPSLLGPIVGLLVALVLLKTRWLVPHQVWTMRPAQDHSTLTSDEFSLSGQSRMRAFAPYALLLVLLVLTRTRELPIGAWLNCVRFGINDLFGTGISAELAPLYSPGIAFVLCSLVSVLWLGGGMRGLASAARQANAVALKTATALFAAITMVRIFVHSGVNDAGLEAMPLVLAESLAVQLGNLWPLIAPWVGALGAFVSGSATFSNLLFASLQWQIATEQDYLPAAILALQGSGAAAGNMVCIHNVVAACAVAGILGQEGSVIRRTALPMLIYLLVAGLLGMLL